MKKLLTWRKQINRLKSSCDGVQGEDSKGKQSRECLKNKIFLVNKQKNQVGKKGQLNHESFSIDCNFYIKICSTDQSLKDMVIGISPDKTQCYWKKITSREYFSLDERETTQSNYMNAQVNVKNTLVMMDLFILHKMKTFL